MTTPDKTTPTRSGLTEAERASLRRMLRYGLTIFVAIAITLVIVGLLSAAFIPA